MRTGVREQVLHEARLAHRRVHVRWRGWLWPGPEAACGLAHQPVEDTAHGHEHVSTWAARSLYGNVERRTPLVDDER